MAEDLSAIAKKSKGSLKKNSEHRRYIITINNPVEKGLTHPAIVEKLINRNNTFFCLVDEIGKKCKTLHTHLYIYSKTPIRVSTVMKLFPKSHIQVAKGATTEIINYFTKSGKWEKTEKADTTIPGTYEQHGEMPSEKAEKETFEEEILRLFDEGFTVNEVLNEYPKLAMRVRVLEELRTVRRQAQERENREVKVHYVFGESGTSIIRTIFERYGAKQVCRITDYNNKKALFDSYYGQRILVFDSFNSNISLEDMLLYTDVFPIDLPARYRSKEAEYDTVYIVSKRSIEKQYVLEQKASPGDWNEFIRRISDITEQKVDGTTTVIDNLQFLQKKEE